MTKLKNIVVALVSLVIFANITNAQEVKAGYSIEAGEPLKVKYIGDDGEYLRFQVILQSDFPARARFAINDKNEGELYSSVLTSNLKVTNVKIEKSEANQLLNFKLVVGKKTYSKTFSVNTRLVETTTVSEADLTKL